VRLKGEGCSNESPQGVSLFITSARITNPASKAKQVEPGGWKMTLQNVIEIGVAVVVIYIAARLFMRRA